MKENGVFPSVCLIIVLIASNIFQLFQKNKMETIDERNPSSPDCTTLELLTGLAAALESPCVLDKSVMANVLSLVHSGIDPDAIADLIMKAS